MNTRQPTYIFIAAVALTVANAVQVHKHTEIMSITLPQVFSRQTMLMVDHRHNQVSTYPQMTAVSRSCF